MVRKLTSFFSVRTVFDVERYDTASRDHAGAQQAVLREEWGLPCDRPVILFVGKFMAQKHAEVLLNIAAAVGSSGHVALVGSGPMEPELRRRVAEENLGNVTFLGFVNQSRLPQRPIHAAHAQEVDRARDTHPAPPHHGYRRPLNARTCDVYAK